MTQARQIADIRLFLLIIVFNVAGLPPAATAQSPLVMLTGEITDEQRAVIVNAEVVLSIENGKELKVVSNGQGIFRFENLPVGKHKLRIFARSFAGHEETIELRSAQKTTHLAITLFPTVSEEVAVSQLSGSALDSERAAGTLILTTKDLEGLPDDPERLHEQLQQLAASSGGIPGGASVTVDGFLNSGQLPSKSSISQVRINPNLYSAEYDTPPFRGGRIEILTKPGVESIHGAASYNHNATALNARDPFSLERADTQTHRYGFNIGAPLVKNKSGVFFDLERRLINEAGIVNAFILDENFEPAHFVFNSPNPQRLMIGSARSDWQMNQYNSLMFRYDFSRNNIDGLGIGGTSLADRGFDHKLSENSFRLSGTAVLSPRAVNVFRLGLTLRGIGQDAVSNAPAIVVAGSFSSGGANMQKLERNERLLEVADYLAVDAGKHSLKFGIQVFNRKISELRAENTNGTFFFGGVAGQEMISSLDQYRRTLLNLPHGKPTQYSLTSGVPQVLISQWLFSGFVQDEWRFDQKLLLSLGLRYEAQTEPTDWLSLAPRLGIAYTPDRKQKWVLRARAGVFYERIGDTLSLEAERLDGEGQRQIIINSPSFPHPLFDAGADDAIPTFRVFDSRVRPPATLQMRMEVERSLLQGWKVSASHSWTKGWSQIRSRNINAPMISVTTPDPLTATRPSGAAEDILQFESSGRLKGRVLYIGVNQNSLKLFSINAGYLNFDFKTDADADFALPQSSYDLTGEWARPFWQSRHVLFVSASTVLPGNVRLFASFNANSGRPFNITTGRDGNGDGNFNDRPGVTAVDDPQAIATIYGFLNPNVINGNLVRNVGTNPTTAALGLNLSRTFVFGKRTQKGESPYKLTANIRANNLLNRSNLSGVNGVLGSPLFGSATTSSPSRRIELGLRFNF